MGNHRAVLLQETVDDLNEQITQALLMAKSLQAQMDEYQLCYGPKWDQYQHNMGKNKVSAIIEYLQRDRVKGL